jgi:hypothetical protein
VFVLSQADLPEQFVSGFAQAEGHFGVYEQNAGQSVACVFDLRVRDDDAALVEWLRQLTGLGAIYPVPARQTSAPQSRWVIRRRSELQLLIGFLRRNPMYGRKAAEFEAWTVAVGAWNERRPDRARMRAAWADVRRLRAYRDAHPCVDISVPPKESPPAPEEMRH